VSSSSRLRGLWSSSPGVEARLPLENLERNDRLLGLSPVPGRDSLVEGREPRLPNQDRRFFFFSGSSSLASATPSTVCFVEIESSSLISVACFKPAWAFAAAKSSSVACFNLCGNQPVSRCGSAATFDLCTGFHSSPPATPTNPLALLNTPVPMPPTTSPTLPRSFITSAPTACAASSTA
jgi:hypothetical protein